MSKPRSPFGPRATTDWFRIASATAPVEGEAASADVYIYEQIGYDWWTDSGVTAKEFAQQVAALDVETIRLHLNSPGGLAFDGLTIMNALRDHKARVEVQVDGLAASAASVIAMAGDHVVMNRGSMLMIHDASTIAWGNPEEIGRTLNALQKLSDSIADTYMGRAGEDREHWRSLMKAETWYTAEEAVAAGLADEWVDSPEQDAEAAVARFDLAQYAFAYAGRAHAPAPPVSVNQTPVSTEPGDPNQKEALTMSDTIKAGLRERLGVTDANASDETLLAALDEALAEAPDTAVAIVEALPEGVQMIDSAVLEDLKAKAAQGVAALAAQTAARREGILATALADGRIAPASKDTWAALLEKDEEGTTKALDSLAKNAIPVTEIGHADAQASEDDALAAQAGWADEKEA